MKTINKLLVSDLRKMWGQSLAISAMLACGIATFVMASSTMYSLKQTRDDYYHRYHFAEMFVHVTRAPNQLAAQLEQVPGISRLQTRVVRNVILDVPGMIEPASCQMISLSENPTTDLNSVFLKSGRFPDPNKRREVLASESFAEAHGWRPGDHVSVIMGGRREQLTIVGTAMSPEFVYAVQPGQIIVDNRRFGVLWMPYRQMSAAFDMVGAFNQATATLQPGASVEFAKAEFDRITETYGGTAAYDRSEQNSHRFLSDEMKQLEGIATVTPSIFLAVAVFLSNIVLSRMVHQQREQIATLRAFGYSKFDLAMYYIRFVLVLVVVGGVSGCIAGNWLGEWMTSAYVRFFRFPLVRFEFAAIPATLAVLVGAAGTLLGSFSAIRRAAQLQPAVAMRPEAPKSSGPALLERLGLKPLLSPAARMVLRRLERNPRATILSVLGMAFGVGVLVLGTFMEDAVNHVIDVQFQQSQRQDVFLTFNENLSAAATYDALHLPGVSQVEPFRSIPVRIRHGHHVRREGLMALDEQTTLFRVLDGEQRQITLSGRGLTLSEKMAELMEIQVGDELSVELMEGQRNRLSMKVTQIFPDFTDPAIYVNRKEIHSILAEGERHSGAFLRTDPKRMPELYAALKHTPVVAGVTDKASTIENFNNTFRENLRPMRLINGLFGFVIAFGVIYSCALITLAERSRDLATLRVMGFTRWEVSRVLLGELFVITLASIPIGLVLGWLFAAAATAALDTETHRFPLIVTNATLAYSTVIILISATASALLTRQILDELDLISVLKVKA